MDSAKKLLRPTLAQVWQDTLFTVSKKLLLLRDITDLVNELRKLSFSVVRFQRVNLLLLNPLYNQMTLYTHDDVSDTVVASQNILFAEGPVDWPGSNRRLCKLIVTVCKGSFLLLVI